MLQCSTRYRPRNSPSIDPHIQVTNFQDWSPNPKNYCILYFRINIDAKKKEIPSLRKFFLGNFRFLITNCFIASLHSLPLRVAETSREQRSPGGHHSPVYYPENILTLLTLNTTTYKLCHYNSKGTIIYTLVFYLQKLVKKVHYEVKSLPSKLVGVGSSPLLAKIQTVRNS